MDISEKEKLEPINNIINKEENINVKDKNENLNSKKTPSEEKSKIVLNNLMEIKKEKKANSKENHEDNNIRNVTQENKIKVIINTPSKKEESPKKEELTLKSEENFDEEKDDFPKDSVSKSPIKPEIKLSNSEIPRDRDELPLNNSNQEKNEISAISKFNNSLSKKEQENQSSTHSNQDKMPDLNNNDYNKEEIQEIKPVIQHNIERKRPVFTLPSDKKRSTSQGKPFHLIQKYYDENFILEDDEEEGFKQYIFNNENSRDESFDNSKNININNDNDNDNNKKENKKDINNEENIDKKEC
jgi:hypothetical protein